nr:calcium-binding protein [Paracoccaceae bacterium]
GFDDISGGAGNDVILGRSDADLIFGGAGDDQLNGGTGADRIRGDGGDDIIIGGADADTFVYETTDFGNDTMFRFAIGADHIEISAAVAGGFDELTIEQDGADAVISFGDGSVTLVNRDAALLSEDDFMFV